MNTAFALAISVALGVSPTTPTWTGNYTQAQEQAAGKKPLAVVFGSGQDGWTKLVRSNEAKKLLAEQYACVYVDTASEEGKKLAGQFSISGNTGIVLSDRSGAVQAYWHQGDLGDASLERSLRKFGDPAVVVSTTEREQVAQVSFYPPMTSTGVVYRGIVQGGVVQGGYVQTGVVTSSCPNGNCPYAR